ncbi:MAG: sulfurtransferase TusA family protein [Candidatus Odinarchaeia archaeon]
MSEEIKPAKTIDARGLQCPMPIVKAKEGINQINSGEILEVLATDLGAKEDFPRWCKRMGHELIKVVDNGGYTRYYIKKK